MLLLPQFALQCGNLRQVRADKPVEGRVVIKELFSGLLSQDSSARHLSTEFSINLFFSHSKKKHSGVRCLLEMKNEHKVRARF